MDNPINPVKTVASLKLWHVLLLVAITVAVLYFVNNHLIVRNVITASTGETFLRNSFWKPLKAADATKAADKALAVKAKTE